MDAKYLDLLKAASVACEYSRITRQESVVVFTDSGRDRTLVDGFLAAASLHAGEVVLVQTQRRAPQTEPPQAAIDAMAAADVVFDIASNSWLYTPATTRIIESGARMLQVLVGIDAVIARPPDETVRQRVATAKHLLDSAQTLRVMSDLGTDLVVQRGDRPTHPQAGFVDRPGMWDSIGLGMVNFAPPEDGATGTVVFNGTVHLSTHHDAILTQPVRARVEAGRLVEISDETLEGRQMARWIEEIHDPRMYTIAHFGFGLDHRADIVAGDIGAWESYQGGVILAFGANISPLLGGRNPAKSHMDTVLHGHDLYIDGRQIIDHGRLVAELDSNLKQIPAGTLAGGRGETIQ